MSVWTSLPSTDQAPSATSATILSATTHPEARDIATPCIAIVDDLAGVAREQNRDSESGQRTLADGRHGGRLGGWVVADQEQHPAARVGAVHIGVPEGVGRPVQAGPLAVPDSNDSIVSGGAHG